MAYAGRKSAAPKLSAPAGTAIAIVRSRFNEQVTGGMLGAAQKTLLAAGVKQNRIDVYEVPGAFEIPALAQHLAKQQVYDGIITLGAVIQGETLHHHYINMTVTQAIMDLSLQLEIPVAFGVITTKNLAQAKARSIGSAKLNKGREAAEAVLEMLGVYGKLSKRISKKINTRLN